MFTLFQTPQWFAGFDLLFDTITLLIALLITAYSYKLYKLSDENKFFYFSVAFALMSVGFLFKLGTYLTIYSPASQYAAAVTIVKVTNSHGIGSIFRNLLYRAGYFVQMASMLGSWLLLFFVSQKGRDRLNKMHERSQILLSIYLITLIAVVSTFEYRIFYLTSLVLLALIVLHLYENHRLRRSQNSKKVLLAFLLLLAAQISFAFIFIVPELYIVGELLTLAGFGTIAATYIAIQQKTKQMANSEVLR